MIHESFTSLIGNTPLLSLRGFCAARKLPAKLLAKLEYFNPAGSIKDRAALSMILDAESRGLLKPGAVIIEPTSGNTGIGLAAVAVPRGYRVILTMPENMSRERQALLSAYGAELVLTPEIDGMSGAIKRAEELHSEITGSFLPGQFNNPANPRAHYETTGPEIWRDTEGQVDIIVAGVGTGGTISGIGRFLKEMNSAVQIVGLEPDTSSVLSGGSAGPHKLQGIGAGFVPDALDISVCDEIIPVSAEDAFKAARDTAKCDGVLLGISSGAALYAATLLANRPQNRGKTIVALCPDGGDRYLSTELYQL